MSELADLLEVGVGVGLCLGGCVGLLVHPLDASQMLKNLGLGCMIGTFIGTGVALALWLAFAVDEAVK